MELQQQIFMKGIIHQHRAILKETKQKEMGQVTNA
jgi:hypothetical protein